MALTMALTMEHITLLDSVVAARSQVTKAADLKTLRLGVVRNPYYADLDPEVAAVMEASLATLRAKGVTLIEADMPEVSYLIRRHSALDYLSPVQFEKRAAN